MAITTDTLVGKIATEHPHPTRVFARRNIDYCCGGDRTLLEACHRMAIDPNSVLSDIYAEINNTAENPEVRWDEAPLPNLIHHILTTFHRPLGEELPRLLSMVEKVCEIHRDKALESLPPLLTIFRDLKKELVHHMIKEERVLFPMIIRGQGAMGGGPISRMMHEHENAAAALTKIRKLTNDYQILDGACNTWCALCHGLETLEQDLHQHIHLENNILVPRALQC